MVRCPGCPNSSRDFPNLTALYTHASTTQKPHAFCEQCKLIFSSEDKLALHLACRSKCPCPVCGKGSFTHAGMPSHRKAKHPLPQPSVATLFACEVACGRSFSSKALRDEHVSASHPACEHCNQGFLSDVVLQTHITSVHSQCNCAICIRNSNAELHCDVCKIQFASQGQLQVHYLESLNHIQCNICSIGFSNVDSANEHTSNVHPSLPAHLTPPSEINGTRALSSNPLDVPHARPSLEEASPDDCVSLSEESDLPPLPPAADIRSRLISSERAHSSESIEKQDSSSESRRKPGGLTSSLNSASVNGLDSDVESNISQHSVSSSPQSFATTPEQLSDIFGGLDSVDTSPLGAVEAPPSPKMISDTRADNVNSTSAEETRGKRSRNVVSPRENIQSFHCRICQKTACVDITVTMCGHIFCNKCITQAVISKPSCPVCRSALLLYCLFRVDTSV